MSRIPGRPVANPERGWRYSKPDPHRELPMGRLTEKGSHTMPQLAAELLSLGTKITPASISRWFIRNGYSVNNTAGQRLYEGTLWPLADADLHRGPALLRPHGTLGD